MRRAVIFANGMLQNPERVRQAIHPGDLLIAADGGAQHCLALGLTPAVVIGDFDSLSEQELQDLKTQSVQMIRHPAHKDFTDLELALQHVQELGMQEVLILGALGARWDQTIANLLLPISAGLSSLQISILDGHQEVFILRPDRQVQILGEVGDTLSLIPLCGDVQGVVTQGLQYPLSNETLFFGATRGISNVFTAERVSISLASGSLLCVIIHQEK
ncbi:MAG TPA: thiamine diphosphokinase [Anaerolineales bacterium]|nr:thiamine diphosphokinase [Anaerolineales bacterium]